MYYKSRYHLTNGLISLALDSLSGELLELTMEKTGENMIKNHCYSLPQPFAVYYTEDKKEWLRPGNASAISRYPVLQPEITVSRDNRSATVSYRALWDGSGPQMVRAAYTVELPEGRAESLWKLSLKNESGLNLDAVRFPCLNGVYIGESWKNNTLTYPYIGGLKIDDPVATLGAPNHSIEWRWQNYRYTYYLDNMSEDFTDGTRGLRHEYSGLLSMKWMDCYGPGGGVYMASYDPAFGVCSMRADTFGEFRPGMNFSIGYPVDLEMGDTWSSPTAVIALHEGDWHRAADMYRAFHRTISPAENAAPEWFRKNPGLAAHYDFKYQNGGVVHHFRDIRGLLDQAREMGLNHLLLSGWHKDGFDHGFPEYVPDKELGTEEELKAQVKQVTDDGGHICFYINSRLCNTKYEHLRDFIAKNTVKHKDGTLAMEPYGADGFSFAVECAGSPGWRKKLQDTVAYLTGDVGLDGMYLDQLSMGYPGICHNPAHDHKHGEWNVWYQKLLSELHRQRRESGKEPLSILHEGVSDSYGPYVAGQLISTFSYHRCGAFPELYRYTFPEQYLVDMLYPGRNLAMRPVHVAQASREIMDRAFRLGMYYWVYDLVDDNTFTRDPETMAYLKSMTKLRSFWTETFGQGVYCDDRYLEEVPSGLKLSCYERKDGLLLACSNTLGHPADFTVNAGAVERVTWYTADDLTGTETGSRGKTFTAPEAPLSLLVLTCSEEKQ